MLASSPNAYWRMGDASGSTVVHSEVNNATMEGRPRSITFRTTGLLTSDADTAGSFVAATPSWFGMPSDAHQTLQDVGDTFTIEVWLKRASISATYHSLLSNGVGNIWFVFDTNNTVVLNKLGVGNVVVSTSTITDTTTKHHVVVTKTGAAAAIYIDGADVSGAVTNQTFGAATTQLIVGADSSAVNGFNGVLDEVAFYPTALSAAVVLSHYQAGIVRYVAPHRMPIGV